MQLITSEAPIHARRATNIPNCIAPKPSTLCASVSIANFAPADTAARA